MLRQTLETAPSARHASAVLLGPSIERLRYERIELPQQQLLLRLLLWPHDSSSNPDHRLHGRIRKLLWRGRPMKERVNPFAHLSLDVQKLPADVLSTTTTLAVAAAAAALCC